MNGPSKGLKCASSLRPVFIGGSTFFCRNVSIIASLYLRPGDATKSDSSRLKNRIQNHCFPEDNTQRVKSKQFSLSKHGSFKAEKGLLHSIQPYFVVVEAKAVSVFTLAFTLFEAN